MKISTPYSKDDLSILADVIARLGVLYPKYEVIDDADAIIISGVEAGNVENVKQAALDQLIRSRFDARSAPLRQNLYKKLLG